MKKPLDRPDHVARVRELLRGFPVVALLGLRQAGKSTLARMIARRTPGPVSFFDLEDTADLARLDDPLLALKRLRGIVVLDEIQRRPDLFPALRVLADRPRSPARFLVLGSASPALLKQSSESLAGRIAYAELPGFSLAEVGVERLDRLWLRGGLPRSFLAPSAAASLEWRRQFVRTFVERDLPMLGVGVPARTIERFWAMLAHYHGQIWNGAEFARAFGTAETTVRRYLDLLAGAFAARVLAPWHENLKKRQVKSPKVYVSDAGLLHALLGIATQGDLDRHPKVGASWEGFLVEETIRRLGARREECHFWATHAGAELDLLVVRGRTRLGFEFKRTSSPAKTRSMVSAVETLGLRRLVVVHAGTETFPLGPRIVAVAARRLLRDVEAPR